MIMMILKLADELYEKKKQSDLNTLNVYNKILKEILDRISILLGTSNAQHCWYLVPEILLVFLDMIMVLIAYLIDKLRDNGFVMRYTHPNLLLLGNIGCLDM